MTTTTRRSSSFARTFGFVVAAAIAVVALAPAAPAVAADSAPAVKQVNVNAASVEQLSNLPRVGEKLAQRIVEYRKANGPFQRPEDLMAVKGIGEKMFELLRPYVATSGTTTLTEKVSGPKRERGAKKGSAAGQPAPAAPQA